MIAEGLSNKQIGARLFISDATVATHIRNIMNKLGVQFTGTDRRLDGLGRAMKVMCK